MEIPINPGTVMGSRWRHGFQMAVVAAPSYYNKNLNRPSGNSYTYRQSGNNWNADKNIVERLIPLMSGTTQIGWRAVDTRDVSEIYDNNGRLSRIEYSDGDVVTAAYDTQGKLTSLTDRQNRSLAAGLRQWLAGHRHRAR